MTAFDVLAIVLPCLIVTAVGTGFLCYLAYNQGYTVRRIDWFVAQQCELQTRQCQLLEQIIRNTPQARTKPPARQNGQQAGD